MANTYKDIIITPNRNSNSADPNVSFRGGNTASNTEIMLRVYPDANGTLSFEGSAGQLFSITNDLSGTIFSVNDVSGIPSLEIDANGFVEIAAYGGNVGIGEANTSNINSKLYVNGSINVTSSIIVPTLNATTINAATVLTTGGINVSAASLNAYGQANNARDQANTARDTANGAYAQANGSYAQANGAYAQANAAANTVAVYANNTVVITKANVNFNNSATINVGVTANATTGRGNIEFTVNTTSTGIVAARDQANTARDTANGAYAQANGAYAQANGAYAQANGAYAQANAAANTVAIYANDVIVITKANVNFNNSATINVGVTANSTTGRGNIEFTVNTTSTGIVAARDQANTARDQANTARDTANGAYAQANGAYAQANGAYAQANAAANTVAVYANDTLVLAKSNVNFNNSSTVNVSVTANSTTGRSNVEFSVNASSTGVNITNDTSTNSTYYIVFTSATSGSASTNVSNSKLTFNPNTGTLSATIFNAISDREAKENIRDLGYGLNTVLSMEGKKFELKVSNETSIGFIAQDLEKIVPEVVLDHQDGYKGVNYGVIAAILVEAIKELNSKIEKLENGK